MAFSVLTRKRLWGRAGNRCAFADCRLEPIEETADGTGLVVVGEEAHIVARKTNGPRGKSDLPKSERDLYENLVLLCSRHHTLIDSDMKTYPVDLLLQTKMDHELWVRSTLGQISDQSMLERYAEIVDEWSAKADLENWTAWSWHLANPAGAMLPISVQERLTKLGIWGLGVIWPDQIPELEGALKNFFTILIDFQAEFRRDADLTQNEKVLKVAPVHRKHRDRMTQREFATHEALYNENISMIEDLFLELTRAANYTCSVVRQRIDPQFRLREGALLIRSGPYFDADDHFHRAEYRSEELATLYPGLDVFRSVRKSRELTLRPD